MPGAAIAARRSMSPSEGSVLVVEDDDAIRTMLVSALRRGGFGTDAAADGAVALELVAQSEYAVIVLDLMMPRLNGFDFLDAFHKIEPRPRSVVIVLTAFDDAKIAIVNANQVHAVIRKPFDVTVLLEMIGELVDLWRAHAGGRASDPAEPQGVAPADLAPPDSKFVP